MYQRVTRGWAKHLDFMLLDMGCMYLAYLVAYCLRHGRMFSLDNRLYRNMMFILFLVQIFVCFFNDSFKNVLKRGLYRELTASFRHVCQVILLVSFYFFLTQEGASYSRITFLMTGILYLMLTWLARNGWKAFVKSQIGRKGGSRSLLIVSRSGTAGEVIKNIRQNNYSRYHLSGLVLLDAKQPGMVLEGIPVVASRTDMLEYICREWVDEVFLDLEEGDEEAARISAALLEMGVTTHQRLMIRQENTMAKQFVERMGNYTVLTRSINMATVRQMVYKRLLDIAGGIVGCLLTGILVLIVGPLIYFQDPGPIFFSQIRVGKNGRKFRIYKFRSMYQDAETRKPEFAEQNRVRDGRMFKIEHDPRIIGGEHGIGKLIRRYSIDEFPQFWNVLKGEMSLVGTRPPTVDEWEKYDLHHRSRLAVKPGITGLWQVSGRSEITDFERVVELDRSYITGWSMGLDLRILFRTIKAVWGKGSL